MKATPEQLHSALTYCIDFARTMLNDKGEFYPFGATVNQSGQIEARGAWTGDEHPNSQEVYALLMKALRAELSDGKVIGIAVVANVTIPRNYSAPYSDGLRVSLESDGYARLIYIPYRFIAKGFLRPRRVADFANPFAVEANPHPR